MNIKVKPTSESCGAVITGLDLSAELTHEELVVLKEALIEHHVLSLPDQEITDDDLERFSLCFGKFAGDPYIASMEGRENMIELRRNADETTPIFAEGWHTDWSFGKNPPKCTVLYGITIPPQGGDTSFINQQLALEKMPDDLRKRLEGRVALHSAKGVYAPDGLYGDSDNGAGRGFKILAAESANDIQAHPIFRPHPDSGLFSVFGCLGYIIGFDGMEKEASDQLLIDLYHWQTREEFQYQHKWSKNMVVMWDNRSVLHKANGGYDGFDRVLHRTVVA